MALPRKALVRRLRTVPPFEAPDAALEQYPTPPEIAADLLLEAHADGAIDGRRVLDLGCGTGMLAIGAHHLGGTVCGIDIDQTAIDAARGEEPGIDWQCADVAGLDPGPFDTVVMNPPFGAQRKGADRPFYDAAARAIAQADDGSIWFFAQTKTQRFLSAYARDLRLSVERVGAWDWPLPATMDHHERGVASIEVGGYRMG